eukprot:921832_1
MPKPAVMKYQKLGETELSLSKIGFGCATLGGVYGQVKKDEMVQLIHKAIEKGVNYFDTSPYYGMLRSETVLGECLKGIPREKFIISTKCGRYAKNPEMSECTFDFSAESVTQSVKDSLKRLQLDYVDIILCHDVEFADPKQIIDEALPALAKLKEQGLVKYIGISGLPLEKLDFIIQNSAVKIDVVLSYCNFNLHCDLLTKMALKWRANGVGIISASPLSMGLLTRSGPPDWHPASAELKACARRASEWCEARELDISSVALQYALTDETAATTLIGLKSEAQLDEAMRCISLPVNEEAVQGVREIFKAEFNKMWC